MRGKRDAKCRLLALILAVAVTVTAILPTNVIAQAADGSVAEVSEIPEVATPGDGDGIFKDTDGYYYYYVGGKRVSETGWIDVGGNQYIYIESNGRVSSKLEKDGDAITYYTYSNGAWKLVANSSKTINNKIYYFGSKNGVAIKVYDKNTTQLYKYTSSKLILVKNDISTVDGNLIYFFGKDGKKVTKAGWYTLASGTKVYVGSKGYVTSKINQSGKSIKYSTYDYKSSKWVAKKNAWVNVSGTEYYFPGNGVASYSYNTKTGKFTVYKNGKWYSAKNSTNKLKNGRIYLVNSKSVVNKKTVWYATNSTDRVYICSKGYVTMKFSTKTGKLLKYNYSKKKWELVKKSAYNVGSKKYYFSSNGIAAYARDSKTGKITVRKNGKWYSAKNVIYKLDGGKLYFVNSKSMIKKKAGWYNISNTEKICVGSKGYVTMKFSTKSGKLTKYNYSRKRWELVKVTSYKIGSKTYYFDARGIMAKNKIVGNNKTGYILC